MRLLAVPPFCCPVVQSAERRSLKPDVGGANPSGAANAGRSSTKQSGSVTSSRLPARLRPSRPFVPERKVVERSPSQGESLAGASPARNASFAARGSRGIADPPDSESGSLERASRSAPTISHSRVAQQWSRRLLTGRLVVRIHPREPALHGDHGVTAAPLFVRQKARGQHPLVTPIWSGDRASERLRLQPACAGSVTLAGLQSMAECSSFPRRELNQQSNGLLSREVRVRVPGDPPFPDRITAVQPPLKRRVLVRLQLREPICGREFEETRIHPVTVEEVGASPITPAI